MVEIVRDVFVRLAIVPVLDSRDHSRNAIGLFRHVVIFGLVERDQVVEMIAMGKPLPEITLMAPECIHELTFRAFGVRDEVLEINARNGVIGGIVSLRQNAMTGTMMFIKIQVKRKFISSCRI